MSEKVYVGVDVGGTAIKAGICDANGNLLHTFEGPTETDQGMDRILSNMAKYARQVVAETNYGWDQVEGVGVGIAGFLDIPKGIVIFSPNLPLEHVPLKAKLEEALQVRVAVNNDANVAALGEAWGGAGRGVHSCVCYTLGTGVGGGIVVGGRLIEGYTGMGGEIGHMSIVADLEAIQCGCGKMGCLETVSSATGIIRMGRDAVQRGDRTSLSLIENLTAKDIFDAAKAGDEVSQRIVARAAFYLGKSMAAVAVIVNPQRFIIGGGVAKAGEFLLAQVREVFQKYTQDTAKAGVDIVAAELGNNAGVVGAAGLIAQA